MQKQKNSYIFFLIAALICIIYSNTLNSSWHLDDELNILYNSSLHLRDLHPKSLANTLISDSDWSNPKFYRPLACFTFAMNWYFGQKNPTGYHIVNIFIHITTAFFLFLVLLQIMRLTDTNKEEQESSKRYFIALLAAALWAAAPIQTQAVTYIVQRMTSLAAMFTILAIYSYLRARTEKKCMRWATLCVLFFLAGIGSKENAVMLPISLLLLEFSFFNHHVSKQKLAWVAVTSSVALLAGLFATHFLLGKNLLDIVKLSRLIDSYEGRSFTLSERILTEPRIILMYLSQIFFPLVSRLSLVHDIQLSTSLITAPWTTLPAILTIFTLIFLSFVFFRRYPLFAFPFIFFFINHIIESTILPLELVFEHRNYLPSFFLFLPVSFLIAQALYTPNRLSPVGQFAITAGTVSLLILFGHATYTRNLAWADEGTLWQDALQKAPSNPRAAAFLGRWYQKKNKFEEALYYFQCAIDNSHLAATPIKMRIGMFQATGEIYQKTKQYKKSIDFFSKCIEIERNNKYFLTQRAQLYLQIDLLQQALDDAENLVRAYPHYLLGKYLAASASYHLGDLFSAQKYMQGIIRKSLDIPEGLYLMGSILLEYKSYPNALFFLRQAADLWPNNAEYQLFLAAAYYLSKNYERAEKVLANVFDRYPVPTIQEAIGKIEEYGVSPDAINYIIDTINVSIEAAVMLSESQ